MSAGRRLPTSELQLRVASAIVLIAVTLLLTWIGSVWFRFLCALIAAAVFYEWLHIAKERSTPSERGLTAMLMVVAGIVIVTGPTGSGKTTTLYAALSELNNIQTKILTAEDPVEYDIDGLCQVQVNTEAGLTFAKALRSFLRQDPDVILVGEIRDLETAEIAVQASLTGHLVFSTLHTNDAPSSIVRLLDLGLESFLLTATIEGIVAQRLVRSICPKCKEPYEPTEQQLMELALTPEHVAGRQLYRGRGCDHCHGSGYKGRMGIFEILVLDDDLRDMIMNETSMAIVRSEARKRGMRTLRECGLEAIYNGQTTIDEVVRETIDEE